MVFQDLLDLDNVIDDFIETTNRNQPLVLFGAGFALNSILLKLEKNGFNIAGICDNDKTKQGKAFNKYYKIMSLEESVVKYPSAMYVIAAPSYFEEILIDLKSFMPSDRICIVDFECGHYFSGREFKAYFLRNLPRFENLYKTLEDDLSKHTLYNVMKAHFSGRREDFEFACSEENDWYLFNSLLLPTPSSVYMDCGAYDGDTILLFNKASKGRYKSIIALEPDRIILPKLRHTILKNNINKVAIVEKGAFNFNGQLDFVANGVYSSIGNSNKTVKIGSKHLKVDVAMIDSILDGRIVDIIKMDIEGAELNALLGAKKTIKKYKPRLAVCLYHNIEDFLEIPELILKMVPEYKLYLRHHSKSCTDTILYAIP